MVTGHKLLRSPNLHTGQSNWIQVEPLSPTGRRVFSFVASRRRRTVSLAFFALLLLSLVAYAFTTPSTQLLSAGRISSFYEQPWSAADWSWSTHHLNSKNYLRGPPTASFRDNLRDDLKYLTSWTGAGWTNDGMAWANMIYLAMITNRVPIIAKFTPNGLHLDYDSPYTKDLAFGEIFDLPRLSKALNMPILEWHEVKRDDDSARLDELGCWSVLETMIGHPRTSEGPRSINADVSYTRAPDWVKLHEQENYWHSSFWNVARLSWPTDRNASLVTPRKSDQNGVILPPDEQLLCFDYLYYLGASQIFEFRFEYSPAWKVMEQMHFTPRVEKIATDHLRRVFNLPARAKVPPYIAIHARRNDFKNACSKDIPTDDCLPPFSAYERRVSEVRQELREQGIEAEHVLMASDEANPAWWVEVDTRGWKHIDFKAERTQEIYGSWYPTVIDAVAHASAAGFVGTHDSTMSLIAIRRLRSWHGITATRMVRWGHAAADDH